ncbi:hypothetical protein CB1_000103028 [Camelus ferus]|nr:hypothetical protein CB1_000103028 [Camelus ferus]
MRSSQTGGGDKPSKHHFESGTFYPQIGLQTYLSMGQSAQVEVGYAVDFCFLCLSPPVRLETVKVYAPGTFTLGVLGPLDCDHIFAQALPSVAAQLAVDRVNKDSSMALGSRLASMVLPTGCDTPSALATFLAHKNTVAAFVGPVNPSYCPAAALLAQGWGKTLFSWACGAPE